MTGTLREEYTFLTIYYLTELFLEYEMFQTKGF